MARKSRFDNIDAIMNSAAMTESEKEFSHAKINNMEIKDIKLENITENPYQPRLQIKNEEIIELANSIKENGLLQPIVLNKISKNKYEVIAGHRRLIAHKLLKEKTIKGIISLELSRDDESYKSKMAVHALIENIQRENLDMLETAISFQNLLNERIFKSKNDLAISIGKNNTYVSKVLSILRLNSKIIKDLEENKTIKDLEVLYELQKIKDDGIQVKLYNELKKGKFTRQELRQYNKAQKDSKKENKTEIKKKPYELKITNTKMSLNSTLSDLNKEDIISMEKEINQILEKYYKFS